MNRALVILNPTALYSSGCFKVVFLNISLNIRGRIQNSDSFKNFAFSDAQINLRCTILET